MQLRLKSVAMLVACAVLFVTGIWAQSLGPAAPEQVAMSRERLARIGPIMQENISGGQMAGGVGLIARHGKLIYFETWGLADKEGNQPMRKTASYKSTP
jgi:CubicO group peptidase (beta-lactamase class C family)